MSVLSFAAPKTRPVLWGRQDSPLAPAKPRAFYIPSTESLVLAAVCLLDLSSTIWWVSYRNASEGNPIMAYYLAHGGTSAFVFAKLTLLVMPLLIAEWARASSPRFVRAALRVGIAAYLGLYAVGVAHINQDEAEAAAFADADLAAPSRITPTRRWANPVPGSGWNPSACGRENTRFRPTHDDEP